MSGMSSLPSDVYGGLIPYRLDMRGIGRIRVKLLMLSILDEDYLDPFIFCVVVRRSLELNSHDSFCESEGRED